MLSVLLHKSFTSPLVNIFTSFDSLVNRVACFVQQKLLDNFSKIELPSLQYFCNYFLSAGPKIIYSECI